MANKKIMRRSEIPNLLLENPNLRNEDFAKHFGVTLETIRSDMIYLEEKGIVHKLHGHAEVTDSFRKDKTHLNNRSHLDEDEKKSIAEAALSFIHNDSIIFLDSGSTVQKIADLLSQRSNVTVITNSLGVANTIIRQEQNHVYLASGFVSSSGMLLNGPYLIDSIKQFKYHFAFLGTNGLKFYNGPTCLNYSHLPVKQLVIKNSENVAVVCSSSKFADGAVMQFATWDEIDYLITDHIPEEQRSKIEKSNVQCVIAK